ncbi:hypothetical protein ACH4E7_43510 [Kitasatospora sp. NPDC018058]|uniref:hypothetical protein n=1 Tax=Kitasatospora sp. NPDC018058 TaxID=3364025 RepID=UPI0037BF53E7
MTIPPPPTEPPTAGMPTPEPEPVAEWWRKDGPRIPAPVQPSAPDAIVHIPVPVGVGGPASMASMEETAAAFWAPVGRILSEQVPAMAAQIGQQVTQLMNETEAQRSAREQVEYEARIAAERAERDALFAAAGESAAQRAERHRVEDVLNPGHRRDDLVGMVDLLAARISETPEERTARLETERELDKRRRRAREDAERAAAGETPEQRTRRHRQQQLADKREAATRARRERRRAAREAGPSDRVRRFRRWCVLTAISAVGGYSTGLVQVITPGGPYVGLLLAAFGWGLDTHLRDRGRLRVSEVRGARPLVLLVLARIPVAAGLTVALGLGNVLAALPLY